MGGGGDGRVGGGGRRGEEKGEEEGEWEGEWIEEEGKEERGERGVEGRVGEGREKVRVVESNEVKSCEKGKHEFKSKVRDQETRQ